MEGARWSAIGRVSAIGELVWRSSCRRRRRGGEGGRRGGEEEESRDMSRYGAGMSDHPAHAE